MVVRAPASRRSPEQAEERLLVEAAQKDPTRFAELYEINFERVYAFVARRVSDRDAAEDLTSEVFHKALANLRRTRVASAEPSAAKPSPTIMKSVVQACVMTLLAREILAS